MNEQNKTEDHNTLDSVNEVRRAWADPVITRIGIKRTMLFVNSVVDGFTGSN